MNKEQVTIQVGYYKLLTALQDPQPRQYLEGQLINGHLLGSELLDDERILDILNKSE